MYLGAVDNPRVAILPGSRIGAFEVTESSVRVESGSCTGVSSLGSGDVFECQRVVPGRDCDRFSPTRSPPGDLYFMRRLDGSGVLVARDLRIDET